MKPALNLKNMTLNEMQDAVHLISDTLVNKTHFSVDVLMRSLMVLEVTMAIHRSFDLNKCHLVFDNLEESIVHRFIMGGYDDLTDFEAKRSLYQSVKPGYGLGVGCGLALATNQPVIVVIDDYALNYGTSFESLLQIATYMPNLTIVLIDEQNSLLRHYSSMDSLIKSVRISKTYTTLKKDVKMILSNPVGKPLLGTMTKVRDGLKQRIIEPTIFTQFGLEYKGPINGSSLRECLKAFEMAKTLSGPQVFHVKTRMKRSFQSSIQFPKFKTDHSVPEGYKSYLEHIDGLLSQYKDIVVFNDILRQQDHLADFAISTPDHYIISSGSHASLLDMMKGYAMQGRKCLLVMDASDFKHCAAHFEEQFSQDDDVIVLLRNAGLAPKSGRVNQGVFDMAFSRIFTQQITMGMDIHDTSRILSRLLAMDEGIRILRLPAGLTGTPPAIASETSIGWTILNQELNDPQGVVFAYGPAVTPLLNKVRVNQAPIWVVNCNNPLCGDEAILKDIKRRGIPAVVYDVEDISGSLYTVVSNYLGLLSTSNLSLQGVDLNLGSKDLKNMYQLNIENALAIFEK